MTEEEIINAINSFINAIEIYGTIDYKGIPNLYEPVIGLLDLYKKEKEKNKKYQGIENGTTIIYKSKAKYVREDRIEKYYINKNKIREFIKKETKQDTYKFDCISAKKLEELLGE